MVAKAKAVENVAYGTSLEGCPSVVAQLQSIVHDTAARPNREDVMPDPVLTPLIEDLGTPFHTSGDSRHHLATILKPALSVELQRKTGVISKVVQLTPDRVIDDVSVTSDKEKMYIAMPGYQTTTLPRCDLGLKDDAIRYSKKYHCLRLLS